MHIFLYIYNKIPVKHGLISDKKNRSPVNNLTMKKQKEDNE